MPRSERNIPFEVFIASLACGFVINTLLVVNNYRDRDNDKKAGKITLVVHIGKKWGLRLYLISGLVGEFLMLFVLKSYSENMLSLILLMVYLLLHFITYEKMQKIKCGKELNRILGLTARNIMIFGILSIVSILI